MVHLNAAQLEEVTDQSLRDGSPLPLSQLTLSRDWVANWLQLLKPSASGALIAPGINAREAVFDDPSALSELRFEGTVDFTESTFRQRANFAGAVFCDTAIFNDAQFLRGASFNSAQFKALADFERSRFDRAIHCVRARFDAPARFSSAHFEDDALFAHTLFADDAGFASARFGGFASFAGARVGGLAGFGSAVFNGACSFSKIRVTGGANLVDASFRGSCRLGPLLCEGDINLRDATFGEDCLLRLSAQRILCMGVSFESGGAARIRAGELVLDRARFPGPFSLGLDVSPAGDWPSIEDTTGAEGSADRPTGANGADVRAPPAPLPRVLSLSGASVGSLAIDDLDLRTCQFAGADGLDGLQLEARVILDRAAHDAARRIIAEERRVRVAAEQEGWRDTAAVHVGTVPDAADPPWLQELYGINRRSATTPADVAAIYRGLRRARENAGDHFGAHEFYYGEMEMRRLQARAAPMRTAERPVLFLYWALCGYALRPGRALGVLLALILLSAALLPVIGRAEPAGRLVPTGLKGGEPVYRFQPGKKPVPQSALITSAAWALPGASAPREDLTHAGRIIALIEGSLGALLSALALVSLRGVVRR